MAWTAYATDWRTDAILDELPAYEIEYHRAVSEHGQATFQLPIPRGGASWLPLVRPNLTGVLICEDDQVRWGGRVVSRPRSGERSYRVDCAEWGTFWDYQLLSPAFHVAEGFRGWDRSRIVESLARAAVSRRGADWPLALQVIDCGQVTDVIEDVQATSLKSVMSVIRDVCDADGAPEWMLSVDGTAAAPRRILRVAPRLGRPVQDSHVMLDFVADTTPARDRGFTADRSRSVLGALYPTPDAVYSGVPGRGWDPRGRRRRHGGNVLVDPGDDLTGAESATQVWTMPTATDTDATDQPGQATAEDLLAAGYPLMEHVEDQPPARTQAERDRYAAGVLASRRGYATGWKFSCFATDPPLGEFQPGDDALVSIESDAYTYDAPGKDPQAIRFTARLTGCEVKPDDQGGRAVVNYVSTIPAAPNV